MLRAMKIPWPTRRWFQFSLRTLLLFVTLSAIPCSWLAVKLREVKREEAAAAALEKAGVTVKWDESAPGPAWLRSVLGEHFFRHAIRVWLGGNAVTDSKLEQLDAMNHLQGLALYGQYVNDASLEHLQGLHELKELDISETQVTDAGLAMIAGLKQLQVLEIGHTKVTDAGLEKLAALNKLQTLGLNGANVTDAGLEHLQWMKQLRELDLDSTQVTAAGRKKLGHALPNCKIDVFRFLR
jgi:hypothetical protein